MEDRMIIRIPMLDNRIPPVDQQTTLVGVAVGALVEALALISVEVEVLLPLVEVLVGVDLGEVDNTDHPHPQVGEGLELAMVEEVGEGWEEGEGERGVEVWVVGGGEVVGVVGVGGGGEVGGGEGGEGGGREG